MEYVAGTIVNVHRRATPSAQPGITAGPPVKGLKHFLAHLRPKNL